MSDIDDGILMAFVDGELDASARQRVAWAVENDPEAREKVRQLRLSAALIRAAFDDPEYLQVPPAAMHVLEPVRQRRIGRRQLALPIAASVLALAFTGGFAMGARDGEKPADFADHLLDEIADYHLLYARETEHQVEVAAAERAHIETWLGDRLGRSLRVPDLSGHGLAFHGARLLVVDGQPVAQLVYRAPGRPHQPLALCITFGAPGHGAPRSDQRNGLNQLLWRRKGYTYVLVGWEPPSLLAALATELTPQLETV
jgi:anti-sigma factor RsiW